MKSEKQNPNAVERRGKYPTRKTDARDVTNLKNFIKRFPTFESGRDKKYVHPKLTIKIMYQMYRDFCVLNGLNTLQKHMFSKIFKRDFELGFIERTKKCMLRKAIGNQQKSRVLSEKRRNEIGKGIKTHKKSAQKVKQDFVNSIEEASDNGVEIFTFEFMRSQEVPSVPEIESLEYRPLWCHTFCVYDEVRHIAHLYVWDETTPSNGPEEAASCLRKHLLMQKIEESKIILYCDPRFGKNRNIKIKMMLEHLFANNLKATSLEQRFFVVGHTYNSCDRCFLDIVKKKKTQPKISDPQEWYNLISEVNQPNKIDQFKVVEMQREDFFSSKQLEELLINSRTSADGQKINWSAIQTIVYDRYDPFALNVKPYGSKETQIISIPLNKKETFTEFSEIDLEFLYKDSRAISTEKYNDLSQLMNYVHSKYHQFYKSMKHTATKKQDLSLCDDIFDSNTACDHGER